MDPSDRTRMDAIERNWDARTPIHAASDFYAAAFRDPDAWFADHEWDDIGDIRGRDVLHLQCHLGTDTAAFARRGARAVGLDLSGAAVAEARRRFPDIEFVHANVYDAGQALAGRRFDVVYTGRGAMLYLPDLTRWAQIVAGLLKPGGILYTVEFHPLLTALGVIPEEGEPDTLTLRYDYLPGRGPEERNWPHTYTDGPPLPGDTRSYEWPHSLGELVTAVAAAGLRVTTLREDPTGPYPRFARMIPAHRPGFFRLPDADPLIPLFFALRAVR
ncbi:class I SAM-dependent methyltransferase, partial [Actinoplanes sp. RD1]|uniref:class I SAM-dependent methyltransferase n=1 Tax=Actinoplanes sp. RD1 TaxID=3064538 RepID=UPI0027414DB9